MAKNTHKVVFLLLLALSACTKGNDGPKDGPKPTDVVLHSVWDMNKEEAVLNSHVGDELYSTLQPVYERYQVIPHAKLIGSNPGDNWACYPRIKQMADGRFIMFYHRSQYGAHVWCTTSDDLVNWDTPTKLYAASTVQVTYPDGTKKSDNLHFVNPDAVVLPNGDVLMVCSYRATGAYGTLGQSCGLSFRRSTNNGKTWGQPLDVEVGPNWEPYMLVLPDGTIQCYYTDAVPWTRNSGTSMIVSKDNGKTWSARQRVCQQYKYDYRTENSAKTQYNGQKIYTDQMPCFRILNDGETILGWLEARLETPTPADCAVGDDYNSRCMMSLVRNHSLEWADLGSDGSYLTTKMVGPADRETNVMKGAGGYVVTFPSGEVAISCGLNSLMSIKIGNVSGTAWRGDKWTDCLITPLPGKGYWSSMEVFDRNFVAIAMHSQETATNGLQVGCLYLNHRLDAAADKISVDGDASEWKAGGAFYLGVKSGEDVIVRSARDDANLYLAAECRDDALSSGTNLTIVLSGGKQGNVILDKSGLVSTTLAGAKGECCGASSQDGRKGWVCEVSIPLSSLGSSVGDKLACYADFAASGEHSTFTLSNISDKETWQRIKLK